MTEFEPHVERDIDEAGELVELIRPLLAGRSPEVIASTLGQLLAILVAGHHPGMRDQVFGLVSSLVRDLVPIEIEQMILDGGCGEDWRGGLHDDRVHGFTRRRGQMQ